MGRRGGFKNIKLGKNVHRQIKRRGVPQHWPASQSKRHIRPARLPFRTPDVIPADTAVKSEKELNESESPLGPG